MSTWTGMLGAPGGIVPDVVIPKQRTVFITDIRAEVSQELSVDDLEDGWGHETVDEDDHEPFPLVRAKVRRTLAPPAMS